MEAQAAELPHFRSPQARMKLHCTKWGIQPLVSRTNMIIFAGCGSGEVGHDHYAGGEPSQPNVTANTNRATLKWRDLVQAATPLPTTSNANCAQCDPQGNPLPAATVGAYEGAFYNHCGAYRPQFNCRMRALSNPYCAVCQRVIRQTIAPFMDSWTWGTNTLNPG